jgi:CyaY protein
MRDSEFIDLAERALTEIERRLEASGLDLDCSPTGDGVLEIEFDGSAKIVLNRHLASHEIWLAARSGGVHFRWDGTAWKSTRDERELMTVLSELVSTQTGTCIDLRPVSED